VFQRSVERELGEQRDEEYGADVFEDYIEEAI
jgi:hypothetical protein